MNFFERITHLINLKGVTRHKLLTDLKINHNAFAKWSNPESYPDAKNLAKIADYFDVSVDYLLGREKAGNNIPLNEFQIAVLAETADINDENVQEKFLQNAKHFKDLISK